jgi:hypothetical protein
MRDRRFIAVHRGGLLSSDDHRALAVWAADVAETLLPRFETDSADKRPRMAIETARAWARGEVTVGAAQKASIAAHAAAREAIHAPAIAAARAAGHAVATAHMADHSLGSLIYGAKCVGESPAVFLLNIMATCPPPEHLCDLVVSGLRGKIGEAAMQTWNTPDQTTRSQSDA